MQQFQRFYSYSSWWWALHPSNWCGCSAIQTHLMKLPKNSSCADVATQDRGFWHATLFSTRRSPVAYHFTAEPLRNWLVGKAASYDSATLKVTELFSKAILLPMFVYWDCIGFVLNFIHLSATGVDQIAKSTNLKGCPHTFACIVYLNKKVGPWIRKTCQYLGWPPFS